MAGNRTQECARHYGVCVRSHFPQGITVCLREKEKRHDKLLIR